ncbi:MAG: hypothetical protein EBW80_07275 [Burkholderiaceae bacterium]|nr:hypothetical protein [Burkholderiaceae bacterium]
MRKKMMNLFTSKDELMTLIQRVLAVALLINTSIAFAKGNADTIFYGGPIVTVNQKNDEVQALAVQGGKIVAVGNKDSVMKDWQSKTTQLVDLKGQTLMPGFVEPPSYLPFMAKMPNPSEAELIGAMLGTMRKMASVGVTTASEMSVGGNFGVDQEIAIYKGIFAKNLSPIRVRGYLFSESMPPGYKTIKPNEGDDRLRFIGIKYISDGSTQGLTAALREPYTYPKGSSWSGALNFKDDEIYNSMKSYFDQGWQISTHSNGDKAIDQTLKSYTKLLANNPKPQDRRLRIEHFTVNHPEQVKQTVKLGVIPSFTIGHVDYWGSAFYNQIIGADRAKRIDPAGEIKRAGGKFTLHSDTPVSNVGPLNYITESVTRMWQLPPTKVLGPDQAISVDDAIRAVTIDAAYQIFADQLVGSLELGKQADLVILEKNPRKTKPEEIRNIKVISTWIDGKQVSLK